MTETWLQITAGQGPVECAWAVTKVAARIRQEAESEGISVRTLELEPGPVAETAQSLVLGLAGQDAAAFAQGLRGVVQWVARSPFRPTHKRKNWFVGIEILQPPEDVRFRKDEVRWETMRASGPGGQHVNRTESAVRVTHLPTGLQATASGERSQYRNRLLALARLARRIDELESRKLAAARRQRWRLHWELVRGNPVRVWDERA